VKLNCIKVAKILLPLQDGKFIGINPLLVAVSHENIKMTKFLLKSILVDINMTDTRGRTALAEAINPTPNYKRERNIIYKNKKTNVKLLKLLLDNKCDPLQLFHEISGSSCTAVYCFNSCNDYEAFQLYLKYIPGTDLNEKLRLTRYTNKKVLDKDATQRKIQNILKTEVKWRKFSKWLFLMRLKEPTSLFALLPLDIFKLLHYFDD